MKNKKLKKWIPEGPYCEGLKGNPCPFYREIWYNHNDPETLDKIEFIKTHRELYVDPDKTIKFLERCINKPYKHKRTECMFGDSCKENCEECTEVVTRCEYLGVTQYGEFPLGDMSKICGIKDKGWY